MPFYFGQPGDIGSYDFFDRGSFEISPSLVGGLVQVLSGDGIQNRVASKEELTVAFSGLSLTEYQALEERLAGMRGIGPAYVVVPDKTNLLHPNQATGGSADLNARGFALGAAGAGVTNTREVTPHYGSTCIKWTQPGTSVAANAHLVRLQRGTTFRQKYGLCVVPGQVYSFGAFVRGGAAWSNQVRAGLSWMNAAGTEISTTAAGSGVNPSTTWQQISILNATPPVGAVFVRPVIYNQTAHTPASALYVDKAQLNFGPSLLSWEPGGASMRVWVNERGYTYLTPRAINLSVTLQEA